MKVAANHVNRVSLTNQRNLQGSVRIACGLLIGRHLTRNMRRLLYGVPKLRIEIVAGTQMVNLFAGEAEIALRSIRPDNDQLFVRRLWQAPHYVYGTPAYREANPAAADERRWTHCRWAGYTTAQSHLPTARWLAERVSEPEPMLRFTHSELILEATASGSALAILPAFVGDDDPRLVRLSEQLDLIIEMWMVTHPDARRLPAVRYIMDRLADIFLDRDPSG